MRGSRIRVIRIDLIVVSCTWSLCLDTEICALRNRTSTGSTAGRGNYSQLLFLFVFSPFFTLPFLFSFFPVFLTPFFLFFLFFLCFSFFFCFFLFFLFFFFFFFFFFSFFFPFFFLFFFHFFFSFFVSLFFFFFQGARILILAWENMCSAFGGPTHPLCLCVALCRMQLSFRPEARGGIANIGDVLRTMSLL